MSDVSSNTTHPISPRKRPFFKRDPLTTVLAVIGIFLVSQFAALFVVGIYPALKNWSEQQYIDWITGSNYAQFATMFLVAVFAVSTTLYLIRRAGVTKARIGLVNLRPRDFLYAVVAYGLYFASYLVVIIAASQLLPGLDTNQEQQIGFEQVRTSLELLMAFVSLVILPPIWEEIVFRGFLFSSLRAKYRFRYAAVLTSLLFAVIHLQFGSDAPLLWVAAIDTFILSMFLCVIREKSASLWPAILLHGFKNLVAFSILFLS